MFMFRNLSLGRRHLVNAYDVKAGIGVIAGNTVWSMPERFESDRGTYIKCAVQIHFLYFVCVCVCVCV